MKKVLIATSSFGKFSDKPIKLLKEAKLDLDYNNTGRKMTEDEVLNQVSQYAGIIAGTERYTNNILGKAKNLKVISRVGVGVDNIDSDVAKENSIEIYRTKTTPATAVAELALGLMLDVSRKISIQNNNLKSGIWCKQMGNLLKGKTLGIIGLGTIGKEVIKLVQGFNFHILAYDINHDHNFAREHQITYCDIENLLSKSDIISIHLNLSSNTRRLLNKKRMAQIKAGSILINTSRGEIIDEKALYVLLKENKISGAGLDVYDEEPYEGKFIELDNMVLTPHIGSYATEIRNKMEIEAAENLIRGLNEK